MFKAPRNCVVSAWTSAGAFVVTTAPAALIGISYLGSADATTITAFDGVTTAGRTVAKFNIPTTEGNLKTSCIPIICTAGIVATNAGTVGGYAVLWTKI